MGLFKIITAILEVFVDLSSSTSKNGYRSSSNDAQKEYFGEMMDKSSEFKDKVKDFKNKYE